MTALELTQILGQTCEFEVLEADLLDALVHRLLQEGVARRPKAQQH